MKHKPEISIIVPVYNHELYIRQCLESILNQEYQDWEAIVINDGSTDESLIIIKEYVSRDSRFKVIEQKNVGIFNLHKTYNLALKIAEGEFIAVLEGDDYWPLDKLSRQIKSFVHESIGLSWGDGIYVDATGHEIFKVIEQDKKWGRNIVENNPIGNAFKYFLFASNFFNMPTCSVMFRKKALVDIGGFWQPEGLKWLDRPTWTLISLKYRFAYCNFNTGYWRRHDKQITSTNTDTSSSLEYMWNAIENEKKEFLKDFENYKVEKSVQVVLTKIYRQLSKKKINTLKDIVQLIFIALSNPIRAYKHFIFVYKIKNKDF